MPNTKLNRPKLRFLCRRGMSEIEILLSQFFDQRFDSLPLEQQQQFAQLLDSEDIDLWDWLVAKTQTPPAALQTIVDMINQHAAT